MKIDTSSLVGSSSILSIEVAITSALSVPVISGTCNDMRNSLIGKQMMIVIPDGSSFHSFLAADRIQSIEPSCDEVKYILPTLTDPILQLLFHYYVTDFKCSFILWNKKVTDFTFSII